MINRIVDGDKKYISIWKIKIPYYTDGTDTKRTIHIGIFRFTYWRGDDYESVYIKILGKKIYYRQNRRQYHYQMRNKLNGSRIKELLEEELEGLIGYRPNLEEPKSFNEKINWLKLNYHNPLITVCCDKYAVKQYAEKIIGQEYILPVIGVWESADQIDVSGLPERFVLKVNWSSGYNMFIHDKSQFSSQHIKQIEHWMQPSQNSYYDTFNWGYKHMKPVVYAEPYIEQIDGQVYDYKFYFSYGKFIFMFISTDRYGDASLTYTFFDEELNKLPFIYGNKPNADPVPEMPFNVQKMIEIFVQ